MFNVRQCAGIAAPFIATYLPKVTTDWMPFLVMGGASALGGLLSLLLPDTVGSPLPDTMEDVETLKKTSKPVWKCINPMKS